MRNFENPNEEVEEDDDGDLDEEVDVYTKKGPAANYSGRVNKISGNDFQRN